MVLPDYSTGHSAPSCLDADTCVLTDRGEFRISDLVIGDHVVTAFGERRRIQWIGRRSFARRFLTANRNIHPIVIEAGALGWDVPKRNLHVSPQQCFFLRGMLIPAWCLINGHSIRPFRPQRDLHYVQIELENHDVILAEGAPAETYLANGDRAAFHNVGDYSELSRNENTGRPVTFAPRIAGGEKVRAVREHFAARNELGGDPQPVELLGNLDRVDASHVRGWAWQCDYSDQPVVLEVLLDRKMIGCVRANQPRPNMSAATGALNRCGFTFVWPTRLAPNRSYCIEVRRLVDKSDLPGSPRIVTVPHSAKAAREIAPNCVSERL